MCVLERERERERERETERETERERDLFIDKLALPRHAAAQPPAQRGQIPAPHSSVGRF